MKPVCLIVSCEHASNFVPERYGVLFQDNPDVLQTHQAYDMGALDLMQDIASRLHLPFVAGNITRLLIDLNRCHAGKMFSVWSRKLPAAEKEHLLAAYHIPYYKKLARALQQAIDLHGGVLHLSIHSFTPVLKGKERSNDIGLLYDPACAAEKQFCQYTRHAFRALDADINIRFNFPYYGHTDGATTFFRRQFKDRYMGIEVEFNQLNMHQQSLMEFRVRNLCVVLDQWGRMKSS